MKTKNVKNEFPVLCDFCGEVIHAGEECVVEFDAKQGTAQFKHKVCPGAFAVVTEKPKLPPPLFWSAGRPPCTIILALSFACVSPNACKTQMA